MCPARWAGTSFYFAFQKLTGLNLIRRNQMVSLKYPLLALIMLAVFTGFASSQLSGSQMAFSGDLNVAGSSFSAAGNSQISAGSAQSIPANNTTINSSDNSTLTNQTAPQVAVSENVGLNAVSSSVSPVPLSGGQSEQSGADVLDLSAYSRDRSNKNLTGYKNIMYPISESRGSTASTAGAGGGCGCG
jgi:hypothetical protein